MALHADENKPNLMENAARRLMGVPRRRRWAIARWTS